MKFLTRNGHTVIVDDTDSYLAEFSWWADFRDNRVKSVFRKSGKKTIRIHNEIIGKKSGFEVDHINRNPLDNRRSNLRFATKSENYFNKGTQKNNKLGVRGITKNRSGNFQVCIRFQKIIHYLGTFKTLDLAKAAWQSKHDELIFEHEKLEQK